MPSSSRNNGNNNTDFGPQSCFVCKVICNNTCSRCGEYYCSKNCQIDDWPNHRYICFRMPNLIMGTTATRSPRQPQQNNNSIDQNEGHNKNATSESQPQSKRIIFGDAPKNNDDVIITFVQHANTFYIRSCRSNSEYVKNCKDFDQFGKNGKSFKGAEKE